MRYLIASILIGFLALPAAAETIWHVAPERSTINFEIQHLIFQQVKGRFKKIKGTIITPGSGLENAQIEAKIPILSIYTGIEDRDKHLISRDFFYSDSFPEIIFVSRSVKKTGKEHEYKILGDLTIRGVTKAIELTATCSEHKQMANGKIRMDFTATGQVSRYDYGLKWNEFIEGSKVIVGENVDILLDLALISDNTGA